MKVLGESALRRKIFWALQKPPFLLLLFAAFVGVFTPGSTASIFGSKQFYPTPSKEQQSAGQVDWFLSENQCSETYLDLTARHGTRNPSRGETNRLHKLQEKIEKLGDAIQNPSYQWIRSWKSPYAKNRAMYLADQGIKEIVDIGARFKQRFQRIFSDPYDPEAIFVQHTQSPRAGQSAQAFMHGLYSHNNTSSKSGFTPFFTLTDSPSNDYTLSFFNMCPNYAENIHHNIKYLKYAEDFKAEHFASIAKRVKERLALGAQWDLDVADMLSMQSACRFHVALEALSDWKKAPWCTVFDENDLQLIAYFEDLEFYHTKGYGEKLNYQMAGVLLKDILDALQTSVDGKLSKTQQKSSQNQPVVQIYSNARSQDVISRLRFGHAETLLPLLCLLDMNRDHFVFDNKASPILRNSRSFKTGTMIPFSANLAFVLYECNDKTTPSSSQKQHYIRTLHNERDVVIPGCGQNLCPYETFMSLFRPKSLGQEEFKATCEIPVKKPEGIMENTPSWLLILVGFSSALIFAMLSISKSANRKRR